MNDIMQSLLQNQTGDDGEDAPEEESKDEQPEPTDDPMGQNLIHKVVMKSVGVHNKIQQEIMHSVFQEYLYHSEFVYVNIHLDKYNVRVINSNSVNNKNYGSQQQSQEFYPNILYVYANRDDTHSQQ